MASPSTAATTPLIDALDEALTALIALVESLDENHWTVATRCPGWTVHDQVAHVVSVEEVLDGAPLPPPAPDSALTHSAVGKRTQRGVHASRDQSADQLTERLRRVAASRVARLRSAPPSGEDTLPGVMGAPMPAARQLILRAVDVWAHEQDIRAAVGRPGHELGPASDMAWMTIADNFVDVLAGAGAQPGQSAVLRATGKRSAEVAVSLDVSGAAVSGEPSDPTVRIELDWMDLAARSFGRYGAEQTPTRIAGDPGLASRVLSRLAFTP